MSQIQVIRPGAKVALLQGEITSAVVNAVMISPCDRVSYQVIWWVAGDRKEQWLESHEVAAAVPDLMPVGFAAARSE